MKIHFRGWLDDGAFLSFLFLTRILQLCSAVPIHQSYKHGMMVGGLFFRNFVNNIKNADQ